MPITTNNVYKHGLPFVEVLKRNLDEQLNERINKKKPSMIVFDGAQGTGKTTLMVEVMDYINQKVGKGPVELSKKHHPQLALGGDEFKKFFNICKKENLPIIAYDEGGDFSRRGAISSFNRRIIRRFETYRSSNIMVLLALPTIASLEQHLFDLQIVRGLIHLTERTQYGNFTAYSGVTLDWLRYWLDKLPKALKKQAYQKTYPDFYGHFLDLPPERAKQLDKLSTYGKDRADDEADIQFMGLLSYADLATRLARSVIYVKKAISQLKIREYKRINRAKYFKKEVLDILLEYKDNGGR